MRRRTYLLLFVGILAASVLGITTDQIWQNVYDSSNTAFRSNVVVGGGGGGPTPTPQATATPLTFGTAGDVVVFNATELGSYAGSTCASGFGTAISAAGALTCATPVPPAPAATATPQPTPTPVSPQYRSIISTSTGANVLATSGNNFIGLGLTQSLSTTEANRQDVMPIAVTVKNLRCYFVVPPGGGTSWTVTVRTGTCGSALSNSSLACTLTGDGATLTCSDLVNSVAISANQCANINAVGTGTPTTSSLYCSAEADY